MEQHSECGTREELSGYRIERAKEDINASKILFDAKEYRAANNRAYYAIYHAICAVNALDGISYKKHKDTIANFNKDYVKEEIFPREIGRKISNASEIRHASDYDDFYIASKEETEEQLINAIEIVEIIEKYCITRIDGN